MKINKIVLSLSISLVASSALAITTTVVATNHSPAPVFNTVKPAATVATVSTNVPTQPPKAIGLNLYDAPVENAKILATVEPDHEFIPIFRQGEWIKVGDPSDGKVGWINHQQYRQAVKSWYQPSIQTVYITGNKDKSGKPQINIVAYSNGKKLEGKEAEALYKQIRVEQQQQRQMMNQTAQQINAFMQRQISIIDPDADNFVDPVITHSENGFGVAKKPAVENKPKASAALTR